MNEQVNDSKYSDLRTIMHERAICVIIPTYNNGGTIGRVVDEALLYCDDIIVVNDGSDDTTASILSSKKGIDVVAYERNRGKGYALKRGIERALARGFAYAITMDGDGQHSASDIPAFVEANRRWPGSIILGNRNKAKIVRSKGSSFANSFSNFWFCVQTLHRLPDTQTGFRLYPLKKLYGYRLMTARYEAELGLLVFAAWHGVAIHSIPVDVYYPPKEERVSHFRPAKDFTRISILNTILCILAVVYALPLFVLRTMMKWLRVAAMTLILVAVVVIFWPSLLLYTKIGPMTERKRWRLHMITYRVARLITMKIGLPGVHFTMTEDASADFSRPSVIICNHQSHLDLPYLLALTPRIIFLTNNWVWHSKLFGFLIHASEYYPAADGIESLMPHFKSLVDRGYSIAIFPEGTRSADCRIARFHQGAFYVAEQLGLDIQTVMLYGAGKVLRKKSHIPHRGQTHIEVGRRYSHAELETIGNRRALTKYFHRLYRQRYDEMSNKMEQDA